jgi:hypothetical protein
VGSHPQETRFPPPNEGDGAPAPRVEPCAPSPPRAGDPTLPFPSRGRSASGSVRTGRPAGGKLGSYAPTMGKTIKGKTFAALAGLLVAAISLFAAWANGNIPMPAVLSTAFILGVATFLATGSKRKGSAKKSS